MTQQTFFFYDLETSGLDSRDARIMQFAGQRTDLDLNPIGEPVNILLKLNDDTLPSPSAIAVTKITPQKTFVDGLTEAEFAKFVTEEIFTPNTIAVGYNTVRFDDEFMRHLFWRTFYDPYEFEWKDGRSRWDLLDVVRMTRALRPEGINWPVTEDGKATNRLELITKLNNISHENAHDAEADVQASIDVAKLIKEKQPELFNFLLKIRNKNDVKKIVNLDDKKPFVYSSGRYSSKTNKTTVAFPLTSSRNGNILVFDLRYNLEELLKDEERKSFYPVVKELCFNRCPAVAPLGVLDKADGWKKIDLDQKIVDENLTVLLKHPEFAEKMREEVENKPEFPPAIDPEAALYDGFLNDRDRIRCEAVRNANANQLADFNPDFIDERLPELLLHYKAKNFPQTLTAEESKKWQEYRHARLERQAPAFLTELEKMTDDYLKEELKLYFESLNDSDYL
ncbi:exodeoxyribonuclease I [Candidatus Saccharibacteria bacterium]|nr:exodeoxyribonuclease I [Candidatus Saccharibacteria bacterium]